MSNDDRLSALERKLQYLIDRQEILDCIVRTSRGNDRFDAEGISASYHEDGLHDLGQKLILGPSTERTPITHTRPYVRLICITSPCTAVR